MRDGVPLPARTTPQLVSQLAYRVFGPLGTARARAMLDYHGLGGAPAGSRHDIATRYRVSHHTISAWSAALRAAGRRQPLTVELAADITRRSTPTQDHQGRVRIATTFGLPPPLPPHPPAAPARSASHAAAADTAIRILATIGPVTLPTLLHAVHRSRRFKPGPPLTTDQLSAALARAGATPDGEGRWQAPAQARAPQRFRALAATLGQQELSRRALAQALIAVGYTPSSAGGRIVTNHPLIQQVGRDRYRLLTEHPSLTRGHSPRPTPPPTDVRGPCQTPAHHGNGSVQADD